jgi:hypothetical protein
MTMRARTLPRRSIALGALAVSAMVVLAACDDGETATEKWAGDVCGAVASWEESIATITTDFSDGISREVVSEKVADAGDATKELVDELKDIGTPETGAGEEAKSAIEQLADDVESTVDTIKDEVEALPGSGAEGLATGVEEIRTELSELAAEATITLEQIRQLDSADELVEAIASNETCQSLRDEE